FSRRGKGARVFEFVAPGSLHERRAIGAAARSWSLFAMTPEEHLRNGQLEEALAGLRETVKKSPADSKPRIFLFQLLCIVGQWEKALTQLQLLSELDADSMLLA